VADHAAGGDVAQIGALLADELPYLWHDAYLELTLRLTNILRVTDNDFTYIFDWYSALEERGEVAPDAATEDRLVGACGFSRHAPTKRDASRQRGWVGPTEKHFGRDCDKGHFIPYALGGGLEINLFMQLRAVNRGWSHAGGLYRSMECYCQQHLGTFFFNRPFYADGTSRPAMLEFGIVKTDGQLWVERFEN
jgi:hypothetical protein